MTVRMLEAARLNAFVAALLEAYRLIAPVRRDGELRFDRVAEPGEVVLGYRNTPRAPKAALFPQDECLMRFAQARAATPWSHVPLDETPTVILGMRPCDARSRALLDRVFGQGELRDPYYLARRGNTLLVAWPATSRGRPASATPLGSGPYDARGADVFLREGGWRLPRGAVRARAARRWRPICRTWPVADAAHLARRR
jgi:sulfhydrogenase subunit beta (sulfur reductase)